jgi:hypothetical protein
MVLVLFLFFGRHRIIFLAFNSVLYLTAASPGYATCVDLSSVVLHGVGGHYVECISTGMSSVQPSELTARSFCRGSSMNHVKGFFLCLHALLFLSGFFCFLRFHCF